MEIKRAGNKEVLKRNRAGNLEYLTFPALTETGMVSHLFTTRLGGVSEGIFSSMNLSFIRGDKKEAVLENFAIISDVMGRKPEDIVCSDQTHTVHVKKVTCEDRGKGITREKDYRDVDGLITDEPGLVLATFYADCVPLFLVDTEHKAIGLSHSGWRGTVNRMGEQTLLAMKQAYGTKPEKVLAAVGPSICMQCYEVSEDVAWEFTKTFSSSVIRHILQDKGNGKYQLDLWKANEAIFLEAGVSRSNISITDICTCCNPQYLFSHRASHGKRGNLGAFLSLTPT